jgi:hypothetical protein
MAVYVNEMAVWQLDTPVVAIAGDGDFDIWQLDTPVVDFDESNPSGQPRRRPSVF